MTKLMASTVDKMRIGLIKISNAVGKNTLLGQCGDNTSILNVCNSYRQIIFLFLILGFSLPKMQGGTFTNASGSIDQIVIPAHCYWQDTIRIKTIVSHSVPSAQLEIQYEVTGTKFTPTKGCIWKTSKIVQVSPGLNESLIDFEVDPNYGWGPRDFCVRLNGVEKKVRFLILPGVILEAIDASRLYYTASEPVDIKCVLSNESDHRQNAMLSLTALDDANNSTVLCDNVMVEILPGQTYFYPYHVRCRHNLVHIDAHLKTISGRMIMSERVLLRPKVSPFFVTPRAALSIPDTRQALDEFDTFADYCPFLFEATKGGEPWTFDAMKIAKSRGLMIGLGNFFDNNLGASWQLYSNDALGRSTYLIPDSIGDYHGSSKVLWALQGFIRGGRDAVYDIRSQNPIGEANLIEGGFEDPNVDLHTGEVNSTGLYADNGWFKGNDAVYQIEAPSFYGIGSDFGPYAPISGYRFDEIKAYRRALSGNDSGIRILSDNRAYKRMSFPELFELVYDRPWLKSEEIGLKSWAEYEPIKITMPQMHGDIESDTQLNKINLHLLLLAYFQAKCLDMWSQYVYNHVLDCQITLNWDFVINGQMSYLMYRLPFIQTLSRELFLSNYDHCITSNYTDGPYWRAMCEKYGKRLRLLQEAGDGGGGPTYFTPYSTLVGTYAEVAGAKLIDFQVDWHKAGAIDSNLWTQLKQRKGMLLDSTLETINMPWQALHNLVELAQLEGFSMAWEDGAERIHDIPGILILSSDRIRYPSTYRGYGRWGDMHLDMGRPDKGFVEWSEILRRNGYLYDTYFTPVFDTSYLNRYRTIIFTAFRHSKGTMEQLHDWLMIPSDGSARTLILNNVLPFQADLRAGTHWDKKNRNEWYTYGHLDWPLDAPVKWCSTANDIWAKLGFHAGEPNVIEVTSLRVPDNSSLKSLQLDVALSHSIPCYVVKPPPGAQTLLANTEGVPLIWSVSVGPANCNRIIYIALPYETLPYVLSPSEDIFERIASGLMSKGLNHLPVYSYTDPSAFVGIYRKVKMNGWKVAIIRRSERVIPARPHKRPIIPCEKLWDWIHELSQPSVDMLKIYGLPANSKYILAETEAHDIVAQGYSNQYGILELRFMVGMAGLYDLVEDDSKLPSRPNI